MLDVVRLRAGEELILFDGSGVLAHAQILTARRGEATLQVTAIEEVDVEPRRRLTIACALPRSSRMDFMIEKCCELGLGRLVPMVTQRSVVDPMDRQQNHAQRWHRHAIEASKQCGRSRLTEITPAVTFESALQIQEPDACRMMASPEKDAVGLMPFLSSLSPAQPVVAFIGPEGGFTPEEVQAARATGCAMVSLGPRILRVETAAIALSACLLLGE